MAEQLPIDLTMLKLLHKREDYENMMGSVPREALDQKVAILLDDFGAYFKEFPDSKAVDPASFMIWFRGFRHKGLPAEACTIFEFLINKAVTEPLDPAVRKGLANRLAGAETAVKITGLLERWNKGDEVDLYSQLRDTLAGFELRLDRTVKDPQCRTPIEELLAVEENNTGINWHQPWLAGHIKALRGGDFVLFASRPDKGKTTWAAGLATNAAPQLDALWPGEKRCVMWLNNEGVGGQIVKRTFQTALGMTIEEMVENKATIREQYIKAIGGRGGALRVFDVHGMWHHEIEDLIRRYRPGMIIWDMIDNVKFGGEVLNGGQRTDQLLEAMYQWVRVLGVKYDCVNVAMSQLSADADGMQWPALPMLKDSKTGKQGAADVIICMGSSNEPALTSMRYFHCTKNKRKITGMPISPLATTIFDFDRGTFAEYKT